MSISKIHTSMLRLGGMLVSLFFAVSVHAQSPFDNPLRARSIMELLQTILQGLVYIGTIALLLALVWCGFLFVWAQGAEERLTDAKRTLMWTLIGGLILLGAEGIAVMIEITGSQL